MPKHADKPFDWKRKGAEKALALCFEGRWTQEEIAEKCSISVRTYAYWREHPDFQARLESLRADFAATLRETAYADKAQRIIGLSQMAEDARRRYEERPWLKEVRPTPDGELTNESFNNAAHAAFRGALDDIAKELGERASNVKVSGSMTHSIVPSGDAKALADEMLDAVRDMPEARAALSARLLASGD